MTKAFDAQLGWHPLFTKSPWQLAYANKLNLWNNQGSWSKTVLQQLTQQPWRDCPEKTKVGQK